MLKTVNVGGYIRKMSHCIGQDNMVDYYFTFVEDPKPNDGSTIKNTDLRLNDLLGKKIILTFEDQMACVACGRDVNKTFSQGYCYPCLQSLAECDTCIIKPELCHFDEGTCRDSEWGDEHCNIQHTIYISLTSGVKIGITRGYHEKTRWVDQGAVQALRIASVDRRKTAGLIEVEVAKSMKDKTNWRKMLKNEYEEEDLYEVRDSLYEAYEDLLVDVADEDAKIQEIKYPVLEYPTKVTSFNFDKNPVVEGVLQGIKGQYLLLDTGVINLRKFAGYKVKLDY